VCMCLYMCISCIYTHIYIYVCMYIYAYLELVQVYVCAAEVAPLECLHAPLERVGLMRRCHIERMGLIGRFFYKEGV
jgi:hypothetical protein